jgi:hypothetical protein
MPSERVTAKLLGLDQAIAQMRRLPVACREEFGEASLAAAKYAAIQARALAPVRKTSLKSYSGGALRQRIGSAYNRSTGMAMVGIEKGALVVARTERRTWVTRARYGQRDRIVEVGKRKGMYVKTGYKMLLRLEERRKVVASGGLVVQPTKYGHFSEIGRGGRRGRARSHPWLRPAVERTREFFLSQMRAAASRTESLLRSMMGRAA